MLTLPSMWGSHSISQLQMSSHKIGVQVGQENVFNLQVMFGCKCKILLDITFRVDDSGRVAVSSPIKYEA